jgi:tRNA threonylcarbamoyladenosine biosynthesis protein TsaE
MIRETHSSEETFDLGESLGRKAYPGQIYTLIGDLGTGKTVFTQGFAKGLGITEYVNSPTFTILQVYEDGRLPLYHFDVYRIEEPEEMDEIGYEDYFFGDGVTLVEWADIIGELIPEDAIRVEISKDLDRGNDYRKIVIGNMTENVSL